MGIATLACAALIALPASAATTYTVRNGDSLWRIAHKHGVSLDALVAANGFESSGHMIHPGDTLTVPTGGGSATASTSKGSSGYTVVRGDSLWRIAHNHGTSIQALINANGLKPPRYVIHPGDKLTIPGGSGGSASAASPSATRNVVATVAPAASAIGCPVKGQIWHNPDFGMAWGGGRTHEGHDMFAARGTPVAAPVSGRITKAGNDGGRGGLRAWLSGSNGTSYYFAHLNTVAVKAGQSVSKGQQIGAVGNTGNAAAVAPHLHFEIHPGGGAPVDPWSSVVAACGR